MEATGSPGQTHKAGENQQQTLPRRSTAHPSQQGARGAEGPLRSVSLAVLLAALLCLVFSCSRLWCGTVC